MVRVTKHVNLELDYTFKEDAIAIEWNMMFSLGASSTILTASSFSLTEVDMKRMQFLICSLSIATMNTVDYWNCVM